MIGIVSNSSVLRQLHDSASSTCLVCIKVSLKVAIVLVERNELRSDIFPTALENNVEVQCKTSCTTLLEQVDGTHLMFSVLAEAGEYYTVWFHF